MPVGLYAGANVSNGNGVTLAFPYNFKILDQTHIEVKVDGVVQPLGVYSVTGVGLSNGGNVVFLVAPANGAVVQRARKVPYKRDQDYQYNGDLREEVVDPDLDTIEMQVQQIAADIARAFKAPLSVTADQVFSDADWAARAGKMVRMRVDGLGPEFVSIDTVGGTFLQSGIGAVPRSWTSKVGEIVSVKDFGALGDGVTDDAAAIQKALDYLATLVVPQTGAALYFPRGIYLIGSGLTSTLSKVVFVGDGLYASTLKASGAFAIIDFSLLTNATFFEMGFLNGTKAVRFFTNNTDTSMVNFVRCLIKDQTAIGVEARIGSNSTQLALNECLLMGGASLVSSYCDYTKISRCWVHTTFAGPTFINNSGTMELDSLLGVPAGGGGATAVWVENHGNLYADNCRFGSEDTHGRAIFYHKVAGFTIRIRDSFCPTDDYFGKFDHLPKNLSLKGNADYGAIGGVSGGKGLWFAVGAEADRSFVQKWEIDDLDFPQKGLFNSTAMGGAAASEKLLDITYARMMTNRQPELALQIACAEALASVDSTARPTDQTTTNLTVANAAYPFLGGFNAKKLTCNAYPGTYVGSNDLVPPGAGNSGVLTAVVDFYVSGATKPFYFEAFYQGNYYRRHAHNGLNVICFQFQPDTSVGVQTYAYTLADIPNGAVILLGRMRLFKGAKHVRTAETVYSDLVATAVPNDAYINHNVSDRIEHINPASPGFMGRVCKTAGQPGVFTTYGPVT